MLALGGTRGFLGKRPANLGQPRPMVAGFAQGHALGDTDALGTKLTDQQIEAMGQFHTPAITLIALTPAASVAAVMAESGAADTGASQGDGGGGGGDAGGTGGGDSGDAGDGGAPGGDN